MDELVAILAEDNRVIGSAPRSVMRRDNLRHSATGVLVRNPAGDIYVHRRTPTKDVYPSRYDFSAGGVVAAGEDPFHAVVRELEEELGISGAELVRLPEGDYADDQTRYHAYLYTCVWDGEIKHQAEEVAWGGWLSPADLIAKLDGGEWSFMPDAVGLLGAYVRGLQVTVSEGWDSDAWIDGPWLYRRPRRDAVRPRLLAEATLLPWLAPQLPLAVPVPELTEDGVRHVLLPGSPYTTGDVGWQLGAFLKALHAVDIDAAVAHGALDASTAAAEKAVVLDEMRAQIVPLLPPEARAAAEALLGRVAQVRTSLIHSDFGPDHILMSDGQVTGVIDWTDAVIGDPALDLCWALSVDGVAETYQPTPAELQRAQDWARLSPWYGVHRGPLLNLPDDVEAGLHDIRTAL